MSRAAKIRKREEKLRSREDFLRRIRNDVKEVQVSKSGIAYGVLPNGSFVKAGKFVPEEVK